MQKLHGKSLVSTLLRIMLTGFTVPILASTFMMTMPKIMTELLTPRISLLIFENMTFPITYVLQ
jgi:hypothetical protein